MSNQNCWEFMKCGRESEGVKIEEFGICPAATEEKVDGTNNGKNGGRACWAIAGTFCKGKVQGTFTSKFAGCIKCDFFKLVISEEGDGLEKTKNILAKL
jgi:hypothetical protein